MEDKDFITRSAYLEKIRRFYEVDLIKVLVGARRSGKSCILRQIVQEISQKTDENHIIFINFEDIEYSEIDDAFKLNDYVQAKIKDGEKYYLFFDEIQYVKNFEKALASFKATLNCSIFITGSNSRLLSGEFASLLVGRAVEFQIMPFSYSEATEFLAMKNRPADENFIYDYIKWGGLPQRFSFDNEEDTRNYIQSVYSGIVEKDIFKRDSEIEKYKFNAIATYILANAGKEFSAENIKNFYNSRNEKNRRILEKKTIYNYIEKLQKAFLIFRVKRFDIAGKEVLKTIEKHYAVDTGFRAIKTNLANYEDTFCLENIVYNELVFQGFEIFTGRTYKSEIDFVAIKGKRKFFIQVAYLLATEETIRREFDAFKPIKEAYPKYVLSLDKIDLSRDGIVHINIVDFLSHKKTL